jgi:hypothetical protein
MRSASPSPPVITVDLLNENYNLMYVGSVYMGSQKQRLDIVFDTGSDWLVLESKTCTNCVSTLYNSDASTTFKLKSSKT